MWTRWTHNGRRMFNDLYEDMMNDRLLFTSPKVDIPIEEYSTIAWNAAWMAADYTSKDEKEFLRKLNKEIR